MKKIDNSGAPTQLLLPATDSARENGTMPDKSPLGQRMKVYEGRETGRRCMPQLPVCARIDGKRFSQWTKGLERPFDARLSHLMIDGAQSQKGAKSCREFERGLNSVIVGLKQSEDRARTRVVPPGSGG